MWKSLPFAATNAIYLGQAIFIDCVCMTMNHEYFGISSGMRTFRTLFDLRSDWLMGKWSVLIGREKVSLD